MEKYRKGTAADMEKIIDFADYVFSRSSGPHDFAQLLPKLYGEGAETSQHHYLVEEDGQIRAVVCVWPMSFIAAGKELKAGFVGTVSVHPRARSKGYMKKLLTWALDDMKAEGYDYSALGGQRQRYAYFGYEPAGVKQELTLTADNVRHCYRDTDISGISFKELTASEQGLLDEAFALYETLMVTGARDRSSFEAVLRSWNAVPYAILQEGKFAGYVSIGGNSGTIFEIELADTALLPVVSKALLAFKSLKELRFTLPAYDHNKIALLGRVCEGFSSGYHINYNMMNFASVIEAFMKCKAESEGLPDGDFTLQIKERETVSMSVRRGEVSVQRVSPEESDMTPDAVLTPEEATALLFSPLSGYVDTSAGGKPQRELPRWFPLPLFTPLLDGC